MSDVIAQFEKIIKKFDEQLQLRALKADFSELLITLRKYVKKTEFKEFGNGVKDNFEICEESVKDLERKLEVSSCAQTEFIVKRTTRVEERLDKKMKERFANVPGYHETTVSESLGLPAQ